MISVRGVFASTWGRKSRENRMTLQHWNIGNEMLSIQSVVNLVYFLIFPHRSLMFVWGFLGLPNLKHILFFSRRSSWHHWAFLKSSPHKKIKNKNKSITRLLYSRATQDLCKTCKTCTGGWGKNKCESTQSGCVYEGFRTFPLQQGFSKHKKNIFFNENKNYTFTNDSQALFEPLPFRDEMEGVCVCAYCFIIHQASWKECR